MPLSKIYGDSANGSAGSRAAVAFIFLYSGLYAVFFNSTLITISTETFPLHLRGYGAGMATFCANVSGIWFGQVTPIAFAAITWRFYAVFIGALIFFGLFYFFFLVEMNQLTLESIAGQFGDETINPDKALELTAMGIDSGTGKVANADATIVDVEHIDTV